MSDPSDPSDGVDAPDGYDTSPHGESESDPTSVEPTLSEDDVRDASNHGDEADGGSRVDWTPPPEARHTSHEIEVQNTMHLAEFGDPPLAETLTDFPAYSELPPELLGSLRSLVNRHELQTGGHLPSPLAVTSPHDRTDTTLVSQGLARILAHEHGRYVLWMGTEWLRSTGAARPADAGGQALLEVLSNRASIRSVLNVDPQHPQLTRLASGYLPPDRGHMVARSPEFADLLSLFEQEFDNVIIDAPALLDEGDGLALLPRTDGYILAVGHRAVSIGDVRRATALASPTPNVGVVITDYASRVPRILRRLLGD